MACPPPHPARPTGKLARVRSANHWELRSRTVEYPHRSATPPSSARLVPQGIFLAPAFLYAPECRPVPFPARRESQEHEMPAPPAQIQLIPRVSCKTPWFLTPIYYNTSIFLQRFADSAASR